MSVTIPFPKITWTTSLSLKFSANAGDLFDDILLFIHYCWQLGLCDCNQT